MKVVVVCMKGHELFKLIQQYSYLGMFIWFAILQLIFPIPQEVALVSIGYISTHIEIHIVISAIISAVGIMVSDLLLFFLAKSGSSIAEKMLNKFSKKWIDKTKSEVESNVNKTLFLLLLLPEVRMLAPLLSGLKGMSLKRFALVDLSANLCLSFVYVFLGRFFYSTLKSLVGKYHNEGHIIFIVVMLVVAVCIIWFLKKKYSEDK